jgi:aconitate hydratase 2/2-methylisocitrate dehydratase
LVELLKTPQGKSELLLDLLINRVLLGVNKAAYIKASFFAAIAKGDVVSPFISPRESNLTIMHYVWRL